LSDGVRRPYFVSPDDGHTLGALLVAVLGLKDWSSVTLPATVPMTVVAGLLVGRARRSAPDAQALTTGGAMDRGWRLAFILGLPHNWPVLSFMTPWRTFLVSRGVIG
jgi:hypothetical protein